ncbi:hypothetical protein BGZ57DRAFT_875206 [Hyaloscypha finlandica]|nr:hypothetical protein BGZ57DRAFT_875206 [Hyaloscypha finlandica]
MATPSRVKNVVVVGATGNLGTSVIKSLLEANKFKITAASRNPPSTEFSSSVIVKTGDYTSRSFLGNLRWSRCRGLHPALQCSPRASKQRRLKLRLKLA